ncbi:MAG: ATP-binding protein, partial [Cellulomonadaceae bacterium]|nr:ATP-binding protein [Cellulomonadaceae bacterium]
MVNFVGRERELRDLSRLLERVKRGDRLDLGITVAMRGRRRIGKSALATEFIKRSGVPSVYFQAARYRSLSEDLATFAEAIAASDLPLAFLAAHQEPRSLSDAFRLLAHVLPDNQPSVVVLDELPWLLEGSPGGAGELQRAWDRELSAKPVLLLLLGSNFGMMEALQKYDQPLYGRATPMVLHELTPVDVQKV